MDWAWPPQRTIQQKSVAPSDNCATQAPKPYAGYATAINCYYGTAHNADVRLTIEGVWCRRVVPATESKTESC